MQAFAACSHILHAGPLLTVLPRLSQVGVVSAFAQTLRRYTSLNHLAQAARAVLQNTSQINQMLSDLNRVDFANVQVTWQCCLLALLCSTGCSPRRLARKPTAAPQWAAIPPWPVHRQWEG